MAEKSSDTKERPTPPASPTSEYESLLQYMDSDTRQWFKSMLVNNDLPLELVRNYAKFKRMNDILGNDVVPPSTLVLLVIVSGCSVKLPVRDVQVSTPSSVHDDE